MTIIHWFRNDLRLADNRALLAAALSGPVLPVYILDDTAAGSWAMGGASRWWLDKSLRRLDADLRRLGSRLLLRRGDSVAVLKELAAAAEATAVHWTRSYEPGAMALDLRVKSALTVLGVTAKQFRGAALFEPEAIRTGTGGPFKVYTPFSRACRAALPPKLPAAAPTVLSAPTVWPASAALDDWGLHPAQPDWSAGMADTFTPGEAGAVERLEQFLSGPVGRYRDQRDIPGVAGTSRLSPHLHFGEISPQTCWHATFAAVANNNGLSAGADKFISEILWREFAMHLLFAVPSLPERAFRPEFEAFPWSPQPGALAAWQRGQTGYPIVDAGMRELWHTGWMHNRVRMIVASFLIKDLHISWQDGEAWFWDTLVDANLANNAAGWQWVAGSGADAAPFFRIFNPITQGLKFDPDGAYVKRWVPELARLPAEHVHAPWLAPPLLLAGIGVKLGETYPQPMVDHAVARERSLAAFQAIKGPAV